MQFRGPCEVPYHINRDKVFQPSNLSLKNLSCSPLPEYNCNFFKNSLPKLQIYFQSAIP
uniref:Uncharacterized protein n=1 Tax=Solanum lycopersicum TaxID=4081 RepID=A0A3Q7JUL0_SOLLC